MSGSDLAVAERAARAAGEVLLGYFGGPARGLDSKTSATDPVSDADRDAERAIRELLEAERPEDGLVGEEGSRQAGESGRRWVVDPLDGTVNFLYGIPQWCVSIALDEGDSTLLGVVLDPVRDELFAAERGAGARLNGEPARVREEAAGLERALIATGFSYEPERRAEQAEVAARLLPRVRDIRRAGSAALDLAWVAAGRLDGYFERGGKAWDWAAGRLLVAEAGGVTRDWSGEPAGLIAAAPTLMEPLAALLE